MGAGPDLVAHPADCHLSSAVAVEFEWVSTGNGTGGRTARKWKGMLYLKTMSRLEPTYHIPLYSKGPGITEIMIFFSRVKVTVN